ncbi:hypothetical protein [Bacillus xiapuensis]|uniref:hypothetical protein n=1 Tax=Bacillus xiapuensis TaxID=2014075 RepID=UPI000C248DCC|nr:hypothetical protein [Bacillus xiapuensis]
MDYFFSFIKNADPTLQLKMEESFPGSRCVGGKYSASTHAITLYRQDIEIQCKRLLGSLDRLREYEWIVLAHELGHALDKELALLSERLAETNQISVLEKIERNAWAIAKQYIPFIDEQLFDYIQTESLRYFSNSPLVQPSASPA